MREPAASSFPGRTHLQGLEIRPLRSTEEFRACVVLQRETWGEQFSECVPPAILKVTQRIGGVTAGSFGPDGRLLGFVFGIPGVRHGHAIHWSHMLAVVPEARNLGLGRRLKEYQRDRVRELGVEWIYWTYDPLVARNAHLNLNRLGVEVEEYVENMYGESTSPLHESGTDRFVVAWRIDGSGSRNAPRGDLPRGAEHAPILNAAGGEGGAADPGAPVVRVEIPADLDALTKAAAARWRATTREAFVPALEQGYRVAGFYRAAEQGPCYYVLARSR